MSPEVEVQVRPTVAFRFDQMESVPSLEEANLQRLLEVKGHGQSAELLTWEGFRDLYQTAKDLAFRNADFEFRERPFLYRDTMLRFIPARFSVPAMVRNQEGKLIRGHQGRILSAAHFALSEEGISHIFMISRGSSRSVALGGKPEYKNLIGSKGELLLPKSNIIDLDGMIFYAPDTPEEFTTHDYLSEKASQRLDPDRDLVVFVKKSSWRGKSATRLEFGWGAPNSPSYESWGHFYHPKGKDDEYNPFGSFMAQVMTGTDLSRFVFPFWLPNGKIVFVEADPLWKHRQNPKIYIQQGEYQRELKLAVDHWAGLTISNLGERYFDALHLMEECSCGDAVHLSDFNPYGPIDLEPFKNLENRNNLAKAKEAFFATGKHTQVQIFRRFASNPEVITRGNEEVEVRLANHTLESMTHTFEADQWLAQSLWSSPEDSLMGTGGFEELYPEIYAIYLSHKEEFDRSAMDCPNRSRTGFIRFVKIVKEKIGSEESLIRAFTLEPFKENEAARNIVGERLRKLGLIA